MAARIRVTSELVDLHSTTMGTMLAAARLGSLDDATARATVRDAAARALLELRTHNDQTAELAMVRVAMVRGLLLAMMEQPDVRRVRTQWDCDGENLLINVRDDGRGGSWLTPRTWNGCSEGSRHWTAAWISTSCRGGARTFP